MRAAAQPPFSAGISPAPSSSVKVSEPLSHPSDLPMDLSPPLIAMVVVLAAAFLLVTYSRLISRRFISPVFRRFRRWRHRRRRLLHLSSSATSSSSDLRSLSPWPFDSFHYASYSPYGLDDSVIKTLPLFLYSTAACARKTASAGKSAATALDRRDCAVCLLEFEDGDYVRTLPSCSHAFHVDCIDEWLRSHPNCPLCRAAILGSSATSAAALAPPSPFVPLMASRIRPSLDEEADAIIIRSIARTPPLDFGNTAAAIDQEIAPSVEDQSPAVTSLPTRFSELKRSYSFGFERGSASERITTEPATVSPWRYRRSAGTTFWSKRASPFGNLISKPRVFSFRYYRCNKSPFFRRRSGGFFPIFRAVTAGGRKLIAADEVDDESDVLPHRRILVEPAEMRRSGGAAIAGEME